MRCDSKDSQQRFVLADKACSCGLDVCVHSQTHMYEGERFTVYIVPLEQCMMCCDECRLMQLLDKPVMSQHTAWATTCALRLRLQARMRARPVKVKSREGKRKLYNTKCGLVDMYAGFLDYGSTCSAALVRWPPYNLGSWMAGCCPAVSTTLILQQPTLTALCNNT